MDAKTGPSQGKEVGLLPNGKYTVWRNNEDGLPEALVTEPVFVLNFRDPIARVAITRYAQSAYVAGYEQLSVDLIDLLQGTAPNEGDGD